MRYFSQVKPWYKRWWSKTILIILLVLIGFSLFFVWEVYRNYKAIERGEFFTPYLNEVSPYDGGNAERRRKLVESADDPFFGPKDAKAVVVEFGDFQCPFCGRSFAPVREVMSKYQDRVKFIYRDFPIDEPHPFAQKAAEAAECAHDQGKFWAMHDLLYLNQSEIDQNIFQKYALQIGVDMKKFNECLLGDIKKEEVKKDFADGVLAGIRGTPTFFFNGYPWAGEVTKEQFESIIQKMLEESATSNE